jgi:hypothetical protein
MPSSKPTAGDALHGVRIRTPHMTIGVRIGSSVRWPPHNDHSHP